MVITEIVLNIFLSRELSGLADFRGQPTAELQLLGLLPQYPVCSEPQVHSLPESLQLMFLHLLPPQDEHPDGVLLNYRALQWIYDFLSNSLWVLHSYRLLHNELLHINGLGGGALNCPFIFGWELQHFV